VDDAGLRMPDFLEQRLTRCNPRLNWCELFALRVFRRPIFEHRDFGVQLGWGLVDLSATMVRSLGARGLWGCGLQGFRCSGVEGFWDWVEGFSGVWGSEVWALEV
jgi:hypothetical protein